MYKITVSNECGCFKRSDLENNITIESKDDALSKAMDMRNTMNNDFCQKHNFELVEDEKNFLISFAAEKTTCCGGGCS